MHMDLGRAGCRWRSLETMLLNQREVDHAAGLFRVGQHAVGEPQRFTGQLGDGLGFQGQQAPMVQFDDVTNERKQQTTTATPQVEWREAAG